jgi:formylglycine-generating enzyme required for sulfatase activity
VEVFIAELKEAVAAGGLTVQSGRPTGPTIADETVYAPASTTGESKQTTSEAAFDSMGGTISSSALDNEEQARLSDSRAAYDRDQEEKERIARLELSRESQERRKIEEEKERKRKEQDERVLKEQHEREERERLHREQIERVERQAKELEERLARLATSMPPSTTVIDPESTQVSQRIKTRTVGNNSFPGQASGAAETLRGSESALVVPIPPPPQPNYKLIIGAVALIVLLVGGGTGAYFLIRQQATGPGVNGNHPTPAPTTATDGPITADLVEIPGGTFQMGRNDGPPQERPEHTVTVQKFFMDRTEVTNAEYARWPVGNVSAKDAQAFAAWRSERDGVTYRLPTEEEWEFAARNGGQYKSFPWGDTFEERHAVVKSLTPRPVGSFPEGRNRWGVVDLVGNISEWTSSKASIYSGREIPPANRDWLVLRGGSYASDPNDAQIPISATYRDWFNPTLRHPTFGFRLVRDG